MLANPSAHMRFASHPLLSIVFRSTPSSKNSLPQFASSSAVLDANTDCLVRESSKLLVSQLHFGKDTPKNVEDFFDLLLMRCIREDLEVHGKQVHSQIIVHGIDQSLFLGAKLISMYSNFNLLHDATAVFECLPDQRCNSLSWNAILRAHLRQELFDETLQLYDKMCKSQVRADGFTFPLVIRASTTIGDVDICKNVHRHVIDSGFEFQIHVANGLVGMYCKLGVVSTAREIFDRMPQRNVISWNTMMSGFALNGDCEGARALFRRMDLGKLKPNLVTWTSLISAHARCGRHREAMELFREMTSRIGNANAEAIAVVLSGCTGVKNGTQVHGLVVKSGFGGYSFVKNALISLYGRCGNREGANKLFQGMEKRDLVTWNSMISCYASAGCCDEAFDLLCQLGNFHKTVLTPNVVTWSAVIGGFSSCGRFDESLELFRRMYRVNILPNCVTVATVLSVCGEVPAIYLGKEIHAYVVRGLIESDILVANGLVHMYGKCGRLGDAGHVFDNIIWKDLISWNSMIAGYAMHGLGSKALAMFDEMMKTNIKPDHVTFIAVLSACCHSGLVNEGRLMFDQMKHTYMLSPSVAHYACMVDLLGRAGLVNEANDFAKELPVEANACVWGALLNSCRIHKNTIVAMETASRLFELEPGTTGSYMLLSNTYAACGRWEDSAKVRMLTKEKRLKKNPGHSWIEVKNKVYAFAAGYIPQEGLEEIHDVLRTLVLLMGDDNNVLSKELFTVSYGEEVNSTRLTYKFLENRNMESI